MQIEREFGEWLQDEYQQRGWKQKEFARRLSELGTKVSNKTVSGWVNGVSKPGDENCVRIAAVLDMELNDVRERAGKHRITKVVGRDVQAISFNEISSAISHAPPAQVMMREHMTRLEDLRQEILDAIDETLEYARAIDAALQRERARDNQPRDNGEDRTND